MFFISISGFNAFIHFYATDFSIAFRFSTIFFEAFLPSMPPKSVYVVREHIEIPPFNVSITEFWFCIATTGTSVENQNSQHFSKVLRRKKSKNRTQ